MISTKYKALLLYIRALRVKNKLDVSTKDFEAVIERLKARNNNLVSNEVKENLSDEIIIVEGKKVYIFNPKNDAKGAIVYLHGGGFIMTATKMDFNWCRVLADNSNSKVYMPIYPLIPDFTLEDMVLFIDAVYKNSLKDWQSEEIKMLGFSAGASLILSYMAYLFSNNMKDIVPKKIFLSSPIAEIPVSEETFTKLLDNDKLDPLFSASAFKKLENYLIRDESYAYLGQIEKVDMKGLCPLYVTYGEKEVMKGFSYILERLAKRDGISLELKIGKGMIHCWQCFLMVKEGRDGQRELIEKINEI
ncbi:MAG: alpha/beta hydrolase [Tissierellia bacterium]|nr:alpha/beta hydrolase [Tissierellia bacterium]